MSTFIAGLIGFLIGAFFFAAAQVSTEKKAAKDGFMKIDGRFYLITPLDLDRYRRGENK